jgi:hypothetical protein
MVSVYRFWVVVATNLAVVHTDRPNTHTITVVVVVIDQGIAAIVVIAGGIEVGITEDIAATTKVIGIAVVIVGLGSRATSEARGTTTNIEASWAWLHSRREGTMGSTSATSIPTTT